MKNVISLFVVFLVVLGCGTAKNDDAPMNKAPEVSNDNAVYTGQVIEKEFYTKGGKATGSTDLYLRLSVQDYFIKFCESKVTKEDIEKLNLGEFDAIKIEGEVKDGEWDSCDPENRVQSRTGSYIVIYAIL